MGQSMPAAALVSNPRPAKNQWNEQERRQVNIDKALRDVDKSPEEQVKKAKRVGGSLIGYDKDVPVSLLPPTTRAS